MTKLSLNDLRKKYSLKDDTMTRSDLQKNNFPIYPIGSKVYSDKQFVDIDNRQMSGTQWTCFYIKDNKSL